MGQSQWEANWAMLHKGNTGYLESITDTACGGLGTDNSSLFIAKFPGIESLTPLRLQLQPQTVPAKFHPEQGHRIRSFLSFHRDL